MKHNPTLAPQLKATEALIAHSTPHSIIDSAGQCQLRRNDEVGGI